MDKQIIRDGDWFDREGARKWSDETGAPSRETLYLTQRDNWVLHIQTGINTIPDTWEVIPPYQAADWLSRRGHALPPVLEASMAALEV